MYQLPELPYLFQDFEPYIDTHTMGLHYNKHHRNYLNNLNNILNKSNYNYCYDINELIFHINEFPTNDREEILFNLGGVLNHNLYWQSILPKNQAKPTGKLYKKILQKYGNYENFWQHLKTYAMKLKGSGYTFLVLKPDDTIDIINTKNQETPLLYGYMPLFNIDLWEHAYYINYENERSRYIDNFKEIANFTTANKIYNTITNRKL